MPRILFLTHKYPPDIGGLATSSARISKRLATMGFETDVAIWSRFVQAGSILKEETELANLNLIRIGMYRQWDMTMPTTIEILNWLHAENQYDAIWGHYLFPSGFLAAWFARSKEIPSMVSARGNDLDREIFPPGSFSSILWTLEKATAISTVSLDLAHKVKVLCDRTDVISLPNVIDPSLFLPKQSDTNLRETFGIADDELVLGFSGELREKKGMRFLLESLVEVRRDRPACLFIIGEVPAEQRAVLQIFEASFPEDAKRLIISGHTEDQAQVAARLQIVDIYLQPSLFEGMPNALLEAMACERVCIASDAGGSAEIIEHTEDGYLIPRSKLPQLGSLVLEIANLPEAEKRRVASNARNTILKRYASQCETRYLSEAMARLLKIPV